MKVSRNTVIEEIGVMDGRTELCGMFAVPDNAKGIVLFAHGSGSSRNSPRNRRVASELNQAGFATLLFDLLDEEEATDREKVFDIPLLAHRLQIAAHWIKHQPRAENFPLGFFGASTGAGAALWAAAEMGQEVSAVVSRGGRPDLAGPKLDQVTAPTLLIVGSEDEPVITMNRDALVHLRKGKLILVPGATHLFEEPGTIEMVSAHAITWFDRYLKSKAIRGEKAKKAA